jgi:integrase
LLDFDPGYVGLDHSRRRHPRPSPHVLPLLPLARATVRQRKTGRPVRFELTEQTRLAVDDYLKVTSKVAGGFLFTSRRRPSEAMTTRQYARLVAEWFAGIGLDLHVFSTHSLRRTKATLIYRRTGNLRAVQLLLGHTRLESTVRYLGIEVRAEQTCSARFLSALCAISDIGALRQAAATRSPRRRDRAAKVGS